MNDVAPEDQPHQNNTEDSPADILDSLRQSEHRAVESLAKDWKFGSFGHIVLPKPDGTFRILLENVNSMKLKNKMRRKGSRHEKINMQCKAFEADVMCHLEPQQN